ncbi:MAG: TRAP transporter large permease subunit [Alphaproteobacteria bacterium]|nr:TRAP transporter large permease subunit [Alphaproteobacteria bacterium]MCB9928621.1 TRAP transporter large permease subunit [Alphaproteobacteria bacterium]
MDSLTIGFCGIGLVLVLLALRVPIAVALATVSIGGIWILRGQGAALGTLGSLPYDFASNFTLSAVPMFLLMGAAAYHTGLTGSLYDAARLWLNRLPGGLAVASNFASAGFAAASGSSVATAAAMGRLAIPEMLKAGYDKSLATGTIAASGTLGALIPPSIAFVIYGWFTEQPVGTLLMAGFLPGVLTAVIYASMIIWRCALNPKLAPPIRQHVPMSAKLAALKEVWPLPLLVLCVMGSIYGGVATPTEAGALGAFFALIIGAVKKQLNRETFVRSFVEALRTVSAVFLVAIGAILLTRFLAMAGVPRFMAEIVQQFDADALTVILAMTVIYLILGMFLDPLGLMLLTLPIFLPAFKVLHIDLIWIGVLVVKLIEIGLLTPPVGLNAYVVKGVVGDAVPLTTIFRGLVWFLVCEAVIMTLLIAFPEISLWLPAVLSG